MAETSHSEKEEGSKANLAPLSPVRPSQSVKGKARMVDVIDLVSSDEETKRTGTSPRAPTLSDATTDQNTRKAVTLRVEQPEAPSLVAGRWLAGSTQHRIPNLPLEQGVRRGTFQVMW